MATAIFPGSFDPVTNGHLDLINRAAKMFDQIIVAVLVNEAKKPLFSTEERLEILAQVLPPKANAMSFQGLLVDFAKKHQASVLVRGLRAVSDFEYEMQMAMMNRELDRNMETVFLMPQPDFSFISSRVVKEVARLGGDIRRLVPPIAAEALAKKFGQPKAD